MPQVFLEYSANVKLPETPNEFLKKLNKQLADFKTFELEKIKTRARKLEHYCMGDGADGKGFVYLLCAILPGRSDALKQGIQEQLLKFLKEQIVSSNQTLNLHFSVHLVELNEYQFVTHDHDTH